MTLETIGKLHYAVWQINHTHRPCTDPRVRRTIQDARINALTTTDNEQDQ